MEKVKKNDPLHAQAYQIIKASLFKGVYESGERLFETKLAKQVGVSRGPIREALRMLTQDGLVEEFDGHLYVYKPQIQDVIDVYLCRQSLESLAIKLATNKISLKSLNELEDILRNARAYWEKKEMEKVIELNTKFHQIIIKSSGNKQLIALTEQTSAKVLYIRSNKFQKLLRNDGSFLDEHEQIFQALVERDEKKAEALMFDHIENDLNKNNMLFNNNDEVEIYDETT